MSVNWSEYSSSTSPAPSRYNATNKTVTIHKIVNGSNKAISYWNWNENERNSVLTAKQSIVSLLNQLNASSVHSSSSFNLSKFTSERINIIQTEISYLESVFEHSGPHTEPFKVDITTYDDRKETQTFYAPSDIPIGYTLKVTYLDGKILLIEDSFAYKDYPSEGFSPRNDKLQSYSKLGAPFIYDVETTIIPNANRQEETVAEIGNATTAEVRKFNNPSGSASIGAEKVIKNASQPSLNSKIVEQDGKITNLDNPAVLDNAIKNGKIEKSAISPFSSNVEESINPDGQVVTAVKAGIGGNLLETKATVISDAPPLNKKQQLNAQQKVLSKSSTTSSSCNGQDISDFGPSALEKGLKGFKRSIKGIGTSVGDIKNQFSDGLSSIKGLRDKGKSLFKDSKTRVKSSSFSSFKFKSLSDMAREAGAKANGSLGKAKMAMQNFDAPGMGDLNSLKSAGTNLLGAVAGAAKGKISAFKLNSRYIKVLPSNMVLRGYQWKKGLNVLDKKFDSDPNSSCSEGGLYFTDLLGAAPFLTVGLDIWEVSIPCDANVVKDAGLMRKWRADKVILVKKWGQSDFKINFGFNMNLPNFKLPGFKLPCPKFPKINFDPDFDFNFDFDFDGFNDEFFDYGKDALKLIAKAPEKIDKWYKPDKLPFGGGIKESIDAIKKSPPGGLKGKVLKKIRSIDVEKDAAISKVKTEATKCAKGFQNAAKKATDEFGKIKKLTNKDATGMLKVGKASDLKAKALSDVKSKFGF